MDIGRGKDCEVVEGGFLDEKFGVFWKKKHDIPQTTYFQLLGFQHR